MSSTTIPQPELEPDLIDWLKEAFDKTQTATRLRALERTVNDLVLDLNQVKSKLESP